MPLQIRPISFRALCAYVAAHHRHHKPPRGGKVFICVKSGVRVVGVASLGRPNARAYDPETIAEISRTCTNGFHNANSKLYGACRQIAKAMGYERVITYTEDGESGASLKAAGFVCVAELKPRKNWAHSSQKLRHTRDPKVREHVKRFRWEIRFASCA